MLGTSLYYWNTTIHEPYTHTITKFPSWSEATEILSYQFCANLTFWRSLLAYTPIIAPYLQDLFATKYNNNYLKSSHLQSKFIPTPAASFGHCFPFPICTVLKIDCLLMQYLYSNTTLKCCRSRALLFFGSDWIPWLPNWIWNTNWLWYACNFNTQI